MPPSSTPPLRDPASSRTAEWPSLSQGEESCARAGSMKNDTTTAAAKPARRGTMTIMRRLYSQALPQTIELLVIRFAGPVRSLIDSAPTQYQDVRQRENLARMDLTRKKPAGGRGKSSGAADDESGYLDGQLLIAM